VEEHFFATTGSSMTRTLTLSSEVYRKFAQGAAERGMTIESLLAAVSDLLVLPDMPSEVERQRQRRIESLLNSARKGQLVANDRVKLDALIAADYESENARADALIRAKDRRSRNGHSSGKKRARK
jgi:hypothetical protein